MQGVKVMIKEVVRPPLVAADRELAPGGFTRPKVYFFTSSTRLRVQQSLLTSTKVPILTQNCAGCRLRGLPLPTGGAPPALCLRPHRQLRGQNGRVSSLSNGRFKRMCLNGRFERMC